MCLPSMLSLHVLNSLHYQKRKCNPVGQTNSFYLPLIPKFFRLNENLVPQQIQLIFDWQHLSQWSFVRKAKNLSFRLLVLLKTTNINAAELSR